MPGIDFRQLRTSVSMSDVLDLLGFVAWRQTEAQVRGLCPLHGSAATAGTDHKHRTFSANLQHHIFRCFKCGAQGNQLDLWAQASRQALYQAALDLCARLHKDVPWLNSTTEKRNP